jgi:hypothetical protein
MVSNFWCRGGSVVIVFKLKPHREDGDGIGIVDFKQGDIAGRAERNDDFKI